MFKKIDFLPYNELDLFSGPATVREELDAVSKLKQRVYCNFGEEKLKSGISELYLILPSEYKEDYSDSEIKQMTKILNRAKANKEITSHEISRIVWAAEYDVQNKECIKFFPMDRQLVYKIKNVAEILEKDRIVKIK